MHPFITLATFIAGAVTNRFVNKGNKKDKRDKKYRKDKQMKRRVFFSFHHQDSNEVKLVRNMRMIDGNTPVSKSKWEEIKKMMIALWRGFMKI